MSAPSFDELVSYARSVRKKILKAVMYDVPARIVSGLQPPDVSGSFVASAAKVAYSHFDAAPLARPGLTFAIVDPESGGAIVELPARTDTIVTWSVDVDALVAAAYEHRSRAMSILQRATVFVEASDGRAIYRLKPYMYAVITYKESFDAFEIFTYPQDRPPLIDESGDVEIVIHGMWFYSELVKSDTAAQIDMLVAVAHSMMYREESGAYVSAPGYYLSVTNTGTVAADVCISASKCVHLEPNTYRRKWVSSLWTAEMSGEVSQG